MLIISQIGVFVKHSGNDMIYLRSYVIIITAQKEQINVFIVFLLNKALSDRSLINGKPYSHLVFPSVAPCVVWNRIRGAGRFCGFARCVKSFRL